MKSGYALTEDADGDLFDIYFESALTWGPDQADKYLAGLHDILERLVIFPELGVRRSDLGPHIRMIRKQSHRIYYRANTDVVQIIRIMHVRQFVELAIIEQADR